MPSKRTAKTVKPPIGCLYSQHGLSLPPIEVLVILPLPPTPFFRLYRDEYDYWPNLSKLFKILKRIALIGANSLAMPAIALSIFHPCTLAVTAYDES